MIDELQYRQQRGDKEKHSVKELDRFRGEPEVWGLEMKPLGDYINGKIVPFPELQVSQSSNVLRECVRESWEKQMLTEALLCLKTSLISSDEKVKVASFKQEKYLVILDVDTDTLSIVNKQDRREIIYQAKRGEAAVVNQFSDKEKESFVSSLSQLKHKKTQKKQMELD
jgi:alpha-D-ribose 1-methylphosphonate 5-triphosphate synthase subunit PhnL